MTARLSYDCLERVIARKVGTTKTSWENCREYLLRYDPDLRLRFADIDRAWVQGFRDYLDREASVWSIDGGSPAPRAPPRF